MTSQYQVTQKDKKTGNTSDEPMHSRAQELETH
jgi:hypothetical protein